jgi:mRNA interferase MazF
MKTAISVPDDIFDSAESLAEELGMSRSELYSVAVAEYVAKYRSRDITAQLDAVYAEEDNRPILRSGGPGEKCQKVELVIARRDIWWADLADPRASEPGFRHPFLIVQADSFNRSRIQTVIGIILTANARLVDAPGNVLIPRAAIGLPRDSVANVSQIVTLDRSYLIERVGRLPARVMASVDAGLRLVLDL